jgi:uncharacterized protein YggE
MTDTGLPSADSTAAGGPVAVVGRGNHGSHGGVVVRGHGEVTVVPDALRLDLAVDRTATSVTDALAGARAAMSALRSAVADSGVAHDDLRTSGLNVWQQYSDGGTPSGFQAGESLTVLVRDIDSIDKVLHAATEAAGDALRVNGLMFVVVDSSEATDEARRQAIAEAERVARLYAHTVGREIGAVVRVAEGAPISDAGGRAGAFRAAKAEMSYGVERGTATITADVTVEWSFV